MYILFMLMLLFLVELLLYLVHCNLSNKIVENGFMVYVFVLTLVTSFLSYQRVGNFGNHPYHFGTLVSIVADDVPFFYAWLKELNCKFIDNFLHTLMFNVQVVLCYRSSLCKCS